MRRALAVLFLFFAIDAVAQEKPLVTMDLVKSGTMLLKTDKPGLFVPLPAVETNVDIHVSGIVLRGEVTQHFRNPESDCVEAVYAFPLPENAAVDRMRMTVGQRTIEGEIREREEAQQVYETARSQGQHASLLTQERPNIFTASIANVGGGEEVVVTIGYQQTVDYKDGAFRFRFPTSIGPRYDPSGSQSMPMISAVGQAKSKFTLNVDLDSGVPLQKLEAPYFQTDVTTLSPTHYLVATDRAAGDRDFELVWQPQLGSEPKSALLTSGQYGLLMVMPPAPSGVRLPKEAIFIIDTSGSMEGPSIEAAKSALDLALQRLRPTDTFDIIEFNSEMSMLFPQPLPAAPDVIAKAREWVGALHANGGTEMLPALQAALDDPNVQNDGVVRQVVFMTDGDVTNESELFSFIRDHLGRSRLFTVGIGNAPNTHFMRNAARFGRGTFTLVANRDEVQQKMSALFEKLESPVLTNVEVRFDDPAAEMWPQRVPDLYAGEPVIVAVKFGTPAGRLIVSGQGWSETQAVASGSAPGLDKLWARQKIEALADQPNTKDEIVKLALEHHLVTQYTSLVAVDTTPSSVALRDCETRPGPVNLPDGWGGAEGSLPTTATSAPLFLIAGFFLIAFAWGLACVLK